MSSNHRQPINFILFPFSIKWTNIIQNKKFKSIFTEPFHVCLKEITHVNTWSYPQSKKMKNSDKIIHWTYILRHLWNFVIFVGKTMYLKSFTEEFPWFQEYFQNFLKDSCHLSATHLVAFPIRYFIVPIVRTCSEPEILF